ncbi:MAG: YwiC-like family protein [Myxococcales bacterium]|nr:YwiC-like family protein [Myxococcales bacterium]
MAAAVVRTSKQRSLAPKEHGAYAQLGLPLLAALLMGRPTLLSALLVVGFACALLAHEPALVAAGRRGKRARADDGARARRNLLAIVGVGASALVVAFGLGTSELRTLLFLPAVFGAATTVLVVLDAERTSVGEHLAAATLSSTCVPVALAGGVPTREALFGWLVWVLGFFAAVSAVRGTIATRKHGARLWARLTPVLAAAGSAVALATLRLCPAWVPVAASPMLAGGLVLAAFPPPPRALTRVGWTLVVAGLATTVLVVVRP